MANPQLGSICNFPTLMLSRRHLPLAPFTRHSPPAKIGFVRLLDSALVRLKPQRAND